MAAARTKLEALITNDPEHPAIREFMVTLETTLALPCEDHHKVAILQRAIKSLENILTIG